MKSLLISALNLLRMPLDFLLLTVDWFRAGVDAIRMRIGKKTGKRKSCTFCGSPEFLMHAERPCVAATKYGNTWMFKAICPCVKAAQAPEHTTPYCTNESAFRKPARHLPLSGLLIGGLWAVIVAGLLHLNAPQHIQHAISRLIHHDPNPGRQALDVKKMTEAEGKTAREVLAEIEILIQAKDLAAAEQELTKLLEQHPDYGPALVVFADVSFRQLKLDAALEALERVEAAGTSDPRMHILRTRKWIHLGQLEAALDELAQQPQAYTIPQQLERSALYQQIAQPDLALEILTEVLSAAPTNLAAHVHMSVLQFKMGDREAASKHVAEAKAINPNAPELRLLEVERSLIDGDLSHFKAQRDLLGEEFHDNLKIQLRIAELERKTKDAGAALERLEPVTRSPHRPERFTAHLIRAQIFLERALITDAATELDLALAIHPSHAPGLQMKAQAHMAREEWRPALTILKNLREDRPPTPARYQLETQCLEKERRMDQAAALLSEAQENFPDDVGLVLHRSNLLKSLGKTDAAIQIMYDFIDTHPDAVFVMNNLVYLLADNERDLDRAYTFAREIMQQRPNDPVFADTIGWMYIKRKQYAEAIPHLEMALRGVPNHPEILYHLGLAYHGDQQHEPARAALERSIASGIVYPGIEEAKALLQQLQP